MQRWESVRNRFPPCFFPVILDLQGEHSCFFSQYWGAGNKEGINRTFGLASLCMLGVALLFGGVAVIRPDFLLRIYTDKENIVQVGIPYIRMRPLLVPSSIGSYHQLSDAFYRESKSPTVQFSGRFDHKFCAELDPDLWKIRDA